MKLPPDLLKVAYDASVTVSQDGDELVFTGSGKQRRLKMSRLTGFLDDGLGVVAREQVLNAIKYANVADEFLPGAGGGANTSVAQ